MKSLIVSGLLVAGLAGAFSFFGSTPAQASWGSNYKEVINSCYSPQLDLWGQRTDCVPYNFTSCMPDAPEECRLWRFRR